MRPCESPSPSPTLILLEQHICVYIYIYIYIYIYSEQNNKTTRSSSDGSSHVQQSRYSCRNRCCNRSHSCRCYCSSTIKSSLTSNNCLFSCFSLVLVLLSLTSNNCTTGNERAAGSETSKADRGVKNRLHKLPPEILTSVHGDLYGPPT